MTNFELDLERGKTGEALVANALKNLGHSVKDVSNEIYYQKKDIDFILSKNGKQTTLEVKNDIKSNLTGNVFIEIQNNNNRVRNYLGWYYYCEADFIAFVQEQKGLAHIITRAELIKLVDSGKYQLKNSYDTQGYIIPVNDLTICGSYYRLKI